MPGFLRPDFLLIFAVAFLVFLYGPVLLLALFSFNDSIYISFPLKGFTFDWYRQMWENGPMAVALLNSVKVGIVVSLISTCFGLFAAKAITRYALPGRGPIVGVIMLPLVVPAVILGLALLILMRKFFEFPLSLWTIGAGHVLLTTPFAMLILASRLEGFEKSLEEASLDLGEGIFSTFWRVTLPLALPGVVAALLLCFTISFDEIVLAFYLAGTDATLPIFIFSQLRFPSALPSVLALSTCILLFSTILVAASEWLRRLGTQSGKGSMI